MKYSNCRVILWSSRVILGNTRVIVGRCIHVDLDLTQDAQIIASDPLAPDVHQEDPH